MHSARLRLSVCFCSIRPNSISALIFISQTRPLNCGSGRLHPRSWLRNDFSTQLIPHHSIATMSAQDLPKVHKFNPKAHPVLPESYRHVSEVPISTTAKLVSFAGQVGMTDPNNPSPSLGDQVRIALKNVDICLAAAGVTKSDIISVRQYLVKFTSMSDETQKARTDVYGQWWRDTEGDNPPPPLTLIGVDCLYKETCLFEVEITCIGKL